MQFAGNAGPDLPAHLVNVQDDQGLCWLLTEWMDAVVFVDKQKKSRSDCSDGHFHLEPFAYGIMAFFPPLASYVFIEK